MAKPVVITERDMIRGVPARFNEQYRAYLDGEETRPLGWDPCYIAAKLEKLDLETATVEDIDVIIGTGGWAAQRCNGCEQLAASAVIVGDVPDFESATATLCGPCLKEAYDAAVASGIIA